MVDGKLRAPKAWIAEDDREFRTSLCIPIDIKDLLCAQEMWKTLYEMSVRTFAYHCSFIVNYSKITAKGDV